MVVEEASAIGAPGDGAENCLGEIAAELRATLRILDPQTREVGSRALDEIGDVAATGAGIDLVLDQDIGARVRKVFRADQQDFAAIVMAAGDQHRLGGVWPVFQHEASRRGIARVEDIGPIEEAIEPGANGALIARLREDGVCERLLGAGPVGHGADLRALKPVEGIAHDMAVPPILMRNAGAGRIGDGAALGHDRSLRREKLTPRLRTRL